MNKERDELHEENKQKVRTEHQAITDRTRHKTGMTEEIQLHRTTSRQTREVNR